MIVNFWIPKELSFPPTFWLRLDEGGFTLVLLGGFAACRPFNFLASYSFTKKKNNLIYY